MKAKLFILALGATLTMSAQKITVGDNEADYVNTHSNQTDINGNKTFNGTIEAATNSRVRGNLYAASLTLNHTGQNIIEMENASPYAATNVLNRIYFTPDGLGFQKDGQGAASAVFGQNNTAHRLYQLPDKNGTIAMLDDISVGGSDNLGDHTATQDLLMSSRSITEVRGLHPDMPRVADIGTPFLPFQRFYGAYVVFDALETAGTEDLNWTIYENPSADNDLVFGVETSEDSHVFTTRYTLDNSGVPTLATDLVPKSYLEDSLSSDIGTTTGLSITNVNGYFGNMSAANSSTTYTVSGAVTGAWAKVRINAATEPSVTGATKISGATFAANTDMYMVVSYNGAIYEYWFLEI